MFYLLLYGYLESTKVSLRNLEDIYNSQSSSSFLILISKVAPSTIPCQIGWLQWTPIISRRYTSLCMLHFQKCLLKKEQNPFNCQGRFHYGSRSCHKLKEGMVVSNKHHKKKHVKYTVLMTDIFPCGVEVFTNQQDHNENKDYPSGIFNYADKSGILFLTGSK